MSLSGVRETACLAGLCVPGYYVPMLSYRHAFHAGNHGDVLKHSVLMYTLAYLRQKEKSFLYMDTHAGAGAYRLEEGYALQNREWEGGIGRIMGEESPLPGLLSRYREFQETVYRRDAAYAGSPLIARHLLRDADRAICFELHPNDFLVLGRTLEGDKRFQIKKEDGLGGLKAALPPDTGRGCVFMDPSYEIKEDYSAIPLALGKAFKRFRQGTYIIWYPLLNSTDTSSYPEQLLEACPAPCCRAELLVRGRNETSRGMYGSGLIIINHPWKLDEELSEALPRMAEIMGDSDASWTLECSG
ncbi:23S rRNA (adenine(2030)-N(6))-methyltransferase RlmJ [Treponema sp. OttesenSCG-928-L16]|nr:23S rRNA (adenine(2030)-N(6))-methyltransferase RlmJ [Treponema sp. OttesenSCG-928-L16]